MSASIQKFGLPTQIIAGAGSHRKLPELLSQAGPTVLVTDEGLVDSAIIAKVTAVLEAAGRPVAVVGDIRPNPDEETVERLTAYLKGQGASQVVAVGGGSPLDAAKAACAMATNDGPLEDYQWNNKPFANPPLPLVAVPTTAGTGSEVTEVAVITSRNLKKGIKTGAIFPKIALIDPELMVSLPPFLTATTGLDALTHAIEAYLGLATNPITDSLALTAIRMIGDSLRAVMADGSDLEAREQMALASTLAGIAMDQAGLGIVHSLSSPVCTFMHLPHGLANALLLPHGMAYNLPARSARLAEIATALGGDCRDREPLNAARLAVERVQNLLQDIGLAKEQDKFRQSLQERTDLEQFGENAASMFLIRNNPQPASAADCTKIFRAIAQHPDGLMKD